MRRLLTRKQAGRMRVLPGLIFSVLCLFVLAFVLYTGLVFMRTSGFTPRLAYQLIFHSKDMLRTYDGRTNILLLGIGGGDHDGSELTDMMMVLSVDAVKKSVALISIPRDIWSDTLKDKVNTAYHYGNLKKEGGGILLAKVIAEDVTGLIIPYSIRIDFSGFRDSINLVGGVDVLVSASFTDTEYPIPGKEHDSCPGDKTNRCVYQTIHFDAGRQHMNGDRALMYVRSRHAAGEEGTDFARNRRQQEVIIALKNKIMQPASWISYDKIRKLQTLYRTVIDTDLKTAELAAVGAQIARTDESSFRKISLDPLFTVAQSSQFGGRYVLVPRASWDDVHRFISNSVK